MRWVARLVIVGLCAVACGHRVQLEIQAPATLALEPRGFESAMVDRIVDGDTIVVTVTGRAEGPGAGESVAGRTYTVRLIGIDTPESVDPRRPVECFGREASDATEALLAGEQVRLVTDVENVDGFDRLLRYIYIDSEMANARLVANGYAHAYTYPPNVRHAELFVNLEREARSSQRGLWAGDSCAGP
jgi:micrococcal nuclease